MEQKNWVLTFFVEELLRFRLDSSDEDSDPEDDSDSESESEESESESEELEESESESEESDESLSSDSSTSLFCDIIIFGAFFRNSRSPSLRNESKEKFFLKKKK